MTARQANAITAVALAGLLAVVSLTAPRWAGALRASPVPVDGDEPAAETTPAPVEPPAASRRRIAVRLFFEAPERGGLASEEREIAFSSDLAQQLRTVVEELAKGPTGPLAATLPAGTRVLDVFVHGGGVAYVDLSGEAASGLAGGSRTELLAVYSVIDTIVSNFPAVHRVQLLVDDRAVASLGGHVDLSRPLPPDMSLLARAAVAPVAPSGAPAAAGSPAVAGATAAPARAE